MKKVGIALAVLFVLAMAVLIGVTNFGIKLFGRSLAWDDDIAQLETLARSFLEDLQYKDFSDAAKYHTFGDQDKVNIAKLIEQMFQVKPETLNIRNFDITRVDRDEDGRRARTFFRATLELLNTAQGDKPNREKEVEGILYWHKRPSVEAVAVPGVDPTAPMAGRRPRNAPPPSATDVATEAAAGPTTETAAATETPAGAAERWFMKLESSLH